MHRYFLWQGKFKQHIVVYFTYMKGYLFRFYNNLSTDTQESLFIFGKLFTHHAHTTTTAKSVSRNLPNTDEKYSIVLCMGKYLAPLCRAWQVFLGLYMAFDGLYFIHVPFFLSHWISISWYKCLVDGIELEKASDCTIDL